MAWHKVNRQKVSKERKALDERIEKRKKPWFAPKEGSHILRFLPPWSADGNFYRSADYHYGVKDRSAIPCLGNWDKSCPACERTEEFRKSGVKRDEEYAWTIRPVTRHFANVLVVKTDTKNIKSGKVYIYGFGESILQKLLNLFEDDEWGNFTDPKSGRNLRLVREGTGMTDTRYELTPRMKESPIKDAIAKRLHDLDKLVEADRISRKEMQAILDGTEDESDEDEDTDTDDDEDTEEDAEEDEDTEEDADEDEDEDEEEEGEDTDEDEDEGEEEDEDEDEDTDEDEDEDEDTDEDEEPPTKRKKGRSAGVKKTRRASKPSKKGAGKKKKGRRGRGKKA